ncbi:HDOD domain-containing protein [Stieleria sp. JC731]|uniref:response regulator n=1 Tax=Pirellulaceae TaxID=2691357 RepID=UPI001E5367D4|nr:response regulator [Stieleria sp. JC731]MCC9600445.1 HDOD domain-containing protein [Stieleria sp. JC731]
MQVLFVDDEPNVLSGLRRMLRHQRSAWDMYFVNGGETALKWLTENPCDVIVTDMRMPGIDGAELLRRVSELYPNTVRLVLSGQSEHEKILRAVGPAHQFMSKPCDPQVLVNTIERACGLHSQLRDEKLKGLISQLTTLPSLPKIYFELVKDLESDDTSVERIGKKIGSDVAMTAKVLQLVNSSFFGLPQRVSCPEHAVSLLGLNVIRPLVLTAKAFSQYEDLRVRGFALQEMIDHSVSVAMLSKRIAESESSDPHLVDDAFIAGMVHDVGKLVLAHNLKDDYSEVIDTAAKSGIPIHIVEQQAFNASHAEVGAHLLGLWGLPHPIVEAVAFHHRPSDAQNTSFSPLTAVHLADCLNHPYDENETAIDHDYIQSLGLTEKLEKFANMSAGEVLQ